MNRQMNLFLLGFLFFFLTGCKQEPVTFDVTLYLSSDEDTDIQVFYNTNYFDAYSEINSTTNSIKGKEFSYPHFTFKTDKKPQRLRIDFNTDKEIILEIDSLKITSNDVEYLVKPNEMKDFFLFNSQVEYDFIDNKMVLKTVKNSDLYDPHIITKNLSKYLY